MANARIKDLADTGTTPPSDLYLAADITAYSAAKKFTRKNLLFSQSTISGNLIFEIIEIGAWNMTGNGGSASKLVTVSSASDVIDILDIVMIDDDGNISSQNSLFDKTGAYPSAIYAAEPVMYWQLRVSSNQIYLEHTMPIYPVLAYTDFTNWDGTSSTRGYITLIRTV